MADPTEGDTDALYLGLLAPALIVLIAGLVIHSFIIGVNVTDWWKGRPVTPVDHVVTSMGIIRMCLQCTDTIYIFIVTFFLKKLDLIVTLFFCDLIYNLFIFVNFWLTSLLSIVFYLKISNFHIRLFLYLKGVIAHRTVCFIVAAVLLSVFQCLIPLSMSITVAQSGEAHNITMYNTSTVCVFINSVYYVTIGICIPLFFSCTSSVLLFTSLYHHTAKMKLSSNLSINLETYYSLMKFVIFTYIYNTMYFIGHFLAVFYYYLHCVWPYWLYIILDFLPALHSSYLIYRTAKLRSQMCKVLQNVIYFLSQRTDTKTRENIEVVTQLGE